MRGAEAPGREEFGEELLSDLGGEVGAEEQKPKLAEAITLETNKRRHTLTLDKTGYGKLFCRHDQTAENRICRSEIPCDQPG